MKRVASVASKFYCHFLFVTVLQYEDVIDEKIVIETVEGLRFDFKYEYIFLG
jgi:hypothetical protein